MSRYHKAFQGFVKVFTGAKQPGVKGSSTTIIGTKPNVGNLKKNQETFNKLKKMTDKYVVEAGKVDPGLKKALRDTGSKSLQKTEKILRKNKKADGGRIGRKFGSKPKTNVQKIKETFAPKTRNLKPVDKKKQKGLAKLPIEVRNKMGYAKKGGRA